MRKYWFGILQGLCSVFLIWRIFSNPELRNDAAKVFLEADIVWLFAGLATALLTESLCAVRWWLMLRLFGIPVGLGKVFAFCGAGLFFSLGLPGAAGGDAFRILYVIQLYPERKLMATLSVLADRLCGLAALIFAFAISVLPQREIFNIDPVTNKLAMLALMILSGVMVLVFLWWLTSFNFFGKSRLPFKNFRDKTDQLTGIFVNLSRQPKLVVYGILISCVALIFHFTTYYWSCKSYEIPVSFVNILTIMPIIDTITLLPISLYGIGLRETLFKHLLGGLYGIPNGSVVMASLTGFALQAAVALIGGIAIPWCAIKNPLKSEDKPGR
jgi:glycosyltransferase 2 family protein